MSKNKINARIENLFSDIQIEDGLTARPESSRSPIFTWEADAEGIITSCDEGVLEVLGINPEQFTGKPFLISQIHQKEQKKFKKIFESGQFPIETEISYVNSRNRSCKTRLTIYQNIDDSGSVIGFRGYSEKLKTTKPRKPKSTSKPKKTSIKNTPYQEKSFSKPLYESQTSDLGISEIGQAFTNGLEDKHFSTKINQRSGKKRKTAFTSDLVSGGTKDLQKTALGETISLVDELTSSSVIPNLPPAAAEIPGLAFSKNKFQKSTTVWTAQAQKGFEAGQIVAIPGSKATPAILSVPININGEKTGLLEIIDDDPNRKWSKEDQIYVSEIVHQLGVALENPRLNSNLQKELSERVKAEREIIKRNKDLANLNQIGQQLNQMVNREQILDSIAESIQILMGTNNVQIALVNETGKLLTFPINIVNGISEPLLSRPLKEGYLEQVLETKNILLVNRDLSQKLSKDDFGHLKSMPLSLISVPLVAGDKAFGVLSIFDNAVEDAFNNVQAEILSSAAAQLATSLEKSQLFSEVSEALQLIEKRQHLQGSISNAIAGLGLHGSKRIKEFLTALSKTDKCEHIYYMEASEDFEGNGIWTCVSSYTNPDVKSFSIKEFDRSLMIDQFPNWVSSLNKKGWVFCTIDSAVDPEKEFLVTRKVESLLLLAVKPEGKYLGFIAFENFSSKVVWEQEEIDTLRTASEALTNTLIREDLLDQLRRSLRETENLYAASHRLALASNFQEMIAAVMSSSSSAGMNHGEIVLFDYNLDGNISRMLLASNYSEFSTLHAKPLGSEYPISLYEKLFSTSSPVYVENISKLKISQPLIDQLVDRKIASMTILPLWSANVQIGTLILMSDNEHRFSSSEKRSYPPLVDQMSTSIQNLRLYESTQIALAETELLFRVSNGISNASNMAELANLIGENAMPANFNSLHLYSISGFPSNPSPDFSLAGSFSEISEQTSINTKIPASALPFLSYPSSGPVTLSSDNSEATPNLTQSVFKNSGIKTAILVPLQTASNPVGFILVGSTKEVDVDPKDLHTLQIIGNSISVAIERQHLLTEAQRRALELQTAAEIARDTTSTLSQDILLKRIVNLLKDRFGYYHCSIYLLDNTNQNATIVESTGDIGRIMKEKQHSLAVGSKSVIGSCLVSGQPVIVNDTYLSPVYLPNPMLAESRSELGIPLKIGGRIIGALDLHSTEVNAFSENELTVLQILTDQISVAIENARAFSISQKAVQEMRELDRVKSQFLANMSHELRTPLNSVIGFSRVILKGIDGPINNVQEQDITSIYNSGMNLLNMINEILDLSKIEAGKMELHLEEVSIIDVISKAVSTATGLVKDKPVELIQKIPSNLPSVQADEIKLGQVVLNLLSNAIKFTEKGTITIEASVIKDSNLDPALRVTVTDSGVGIAPADQPKLFQRFSQVDDSPTRKTGGTGLGLSISRSLIEMHGGKIGLVNSTPGKGSTFYFTLPIPVKQKGLDPQQSGHGENVILSIDDDPQVIALYERYLRNYGFEVIALTNPERAVEKAVELKPFAITLDIMMPQVDGWHVLHELKQDERTRDIPILVCSILEEEEKGFSLGASEYLVKPFLQDDLINAIHRINQDGQKMEVLIIDDDPDDLQFARKMVEADPDFHPILAEGGQSALKVLDNLTPDLIILDLFMPDMNGFELLDKFKSEPRLANVPVIILTGANLTHEQKTQLVESSKALATHGLIKESDILKNLEEALQKIKPKLL